tara:strand:+ start:477 stop:869 length:393 start_codon:yes stop_codon:yes gene_type:complete
MIDSDSSSLNDQSMVGRIIRQQRIQILMAFLTIFLTEAGMALTHTFAAAGHTHWSHVPWVEGLNIANWFHVFSFASHYPIVLFVCWLVFGIRRWDYWIYAGIGSSFLWSAVKLQAGKDWPMWYQQVWSWL